MNFGDARLPVRFWERVRECPTSGCWIWEGPRCGKGYGRVSIDGVAGSTHRLTLSTISPITPGLDVDHLCRVPGCCNPAHLEAVTRAENIRRGLTGKWQTAKTHCPQGHEYTDENTYRPVRKDERKAGTSERQCRTCSYERNKIYAARRKAMGRAA